MTNYEKKRDQLVKQLLTCTHMIKGSISSVCSRCTRANCICKTDTGARTHRLTYKDKDQKTKIVYVPKAKLGEVKKMISNYKRCKSIIDKLMDVNIMIFKES